MIIKSAPLYVLTADHDWIDLGEGAAYRVTADGDLIVELANGSNASYSFDEWIDVKFVPRKSDYE